MSKAARRVKSRPVRTHARRKVAHIQRQAATKPSSAIVVRSPGPKPWLIQPEELTILKNAVCKGATDTELQYCLTVARRRGLDPFKGQIWFVPRNDRGADDGQGGSGAKVWIPVTSIGGLCHVGARDHKDYGSFSEPEYGPMMTVEWQWKGQGVPKKLQVPEWARVEAYKKGIAQPTVGKVWWSEIYPNINFAPMVRQMPRRMLAKCAQAQAIRLAYPETGGLYIQEEMQELGPPQYTEGGREIRVEPAQIVDEFFCQKHRCDISKCPAHEHTAAENDAMLKLEQTRRLTPAQKEVVERKTSVSSPSNEGAKQEVRPVEKKVLTYLWFENSQSARLDQPKFAIMPDLKAILQKLVRQGHVAPNGEELEVLKWECEKRGIILQRRREPGE